MRFLKYLGCLTVVFLCLTGCGAAKGNAGFYSDIAGSRDAGSGDGNHRSGQED